MGNKGHTVDEKRLTNQSDNNSCTSDCFNFNRNNAVNGYKKFLSIMLVFTFICCFRAYIFDRVIVSGNSMNPTYSDGDVMWARKFDISELKRYQVVVADIQGKFVIKRVIGLPNETLQIIDGNVYINGEILKDDYGYPTKIYGCAADEIIIGENEYFLMGDNRDDSLDCRIWGSVNIESIKGVIVFQFFPFWKIGFVE